MVGFCRLVSAPLAYDTCVFTKEAVISQIKLDGEDMIRCSCACLCGHHRRKRETHSSVRNSGVAVSGDDLNCFMPFVALHVHQTTNRRYFDYFFLFFCFTYPFAYRRPRWRKASANSFPLLRDVKRKLHTGSRQALLFVLSLLSPVFCLLGGPCTYV